MFSSIKTTRRYFLKSALLGSIYLALPGFICAESRIKRGKASRYGEGLYGAGTYGKARPLHKQDHRFMTNCNNLQT